MTQEIRVTIKKDGSAVVATSGNPGKSCVEATKELELLLGEQNGNKEFTAEYFKPDPKPTDTWIKRT